MQLDRYLGEVGRMLQHTLEDTNMKVKAAASRAFTSFVLSLEEKEQRAAFIPLTTGAYLSCSPFSLSCCASAWLKRGRAQPNLAVACVTLNLTWNMPCMLCMG